MAAVTIRSRGQECIATGVVLASDETPFELVISEGTERLTLHCSLVDDEKGPAERRPALSFNQINDEIAAVRFYNIGRKSPVALTFGPIAAATFKDRSLSMLFDIRRADIAVILNYSFWLRTD